MNYNLRRFIEPQEKHFEEALKEIKREKKETHWMWYIFPQIKGLGESFTSEYYGIESLDEARAYMANKKLAKNLIEITKAVLTLKTNDILDVFGWPDNLKLKSSMTVFYKATNNTLFLDVIDKFFNGELDSLTISLIGEGK